MRERYKKTSIGEIPRNWELGTFGNYTKVNQGLQIPISKRLKTYVEGSYRYITIQFIKKPNEESNIYYVMSPEQSVICTKNEILMTRTGNTGIVVTDVEGVFHNNFFKVDFNRNEFNKDFMFYYLNSFPIQKLILIYAGGTTILDLNHGDFYKIPLVKPPLPEQQKIAEILSTVDDKIELINQQITETQELKKGLMQRLLTKGIGHKKFKDSPLGRIPESWEVKIIDDFVLSFKGGAALRPSDFVKEKGFPVIPKKAIGKGGTLEIDHSKPTFCSISFAKNNKNNIIDKEYIVTTLRDLVPSGPSIGYMVLIQSEENYILAQGVYGFKVNNHISREFLIQYSNTLQFRRVMQKIKVGSTQVHIRNKDYFGVQIPVPPLSEQQKIADILSSVDKKLKILKEKKTHYQELKKGLMQQLLTGKIRVKTSNTLIR